MPAAGYDSGTGRRGSAETEGFYWSSTEGVALNARYLYFSERIVFLNAYDISTGMSVRAVRDAE